MQSEAVSPSSLWGKSAWTGCFTAPVSVPPGFSLKMAVLPFLCYMPQSGSILVQVEPIPFVQALLVPKCSPVPNKFKAFLSTPSSHSCIETPQLCPSVWPSVWTGSILEKGTLELLAFRTSQLHFPTFIGANMCHTYWFLLGLKYFLLLSILGTFFVNFLF